MARTLYMSDGSVEVVVGDEKETLRRIIRERLGDDCVELFDELTYEDEVEFDYSAEDDYD